MIKVIIENKWVVKEEHTGTLFFSRLEHNEQMQKESAVFEELSSRTRLYKSARSAQCAARRITQVGFDGQPVPEYIERAEVSDLPELADKKPAEPPVITDIMGWKTLDKFGKIAYLSRPNEYGVPEYAYIDKNSDLRWLGTDELAAWYTYSEERMEKGAEIIKARRQGGTV